MDLDSFRTEIDDIDRQLVELFVRRMTIVADIARYKIRQNIPVFHPERERQVIEKAKERADAAMAPYVEKFFTSTMEISRLLQEELITRDRSTLP